MGYELTDIQSGLELLSSRPRSEGETAFPEIATIVDSVKLAARERRIAGQRELRIAEEAAEARRRRLHPEEYEPIGPADLEAMAAKLGDKFKFERPKAKVIPEPKIENCPHCSKPLPVVGNIRFWTAKEIYEYAALKEESERIADMNREANKAHAEKCSAEQLANLPATPVPDISEEVA